MGISGDDLFFRELLSSALKGEGYGVVCVRILRGRKPVFQLMIERLDKKPVGLKDCQKVSCYVSTILDVEDPIAGAFSLEVSSPGVNRPLVTSADFSAYEGERVEVVIRFPREGQRVFRGILRGKEGECVLLQEQQLGLTTLPFSEITKACLMPCDVHSTGERELMEGEQR